MLFRISEYSSVCFRDCLSFCLPIRESCFSIVAIHLIDSKLIEKYVLKTTCSIDPELLIIAVVFFGGLFGTPFMFIAAPIATIINYFAKESVNRLILDRKRDVKTEDTVGSEADDTTEND